MKIEYLSRGEFVKKYGPSSAGWHYTTEEGEHVVVLPKGASTKTRMHEIAHAELGHETRERITFSDWAQRELGADSWVYEKLGRDPSFRELLADLKPIAEKAFERGYSVANVMSWLVGELEEAGYIVEREDRSTVWWWLRDLHEEVKER